ncbi:hypothetical protein ACFZCL_41820 [Streptomyces sp. NPDC008159]
MARLPPVIKATFPSSRFMPSIAGPTSGSWREPDLAFGDINSIA